MSQVQEIVGGAHFAQSYSGNGSALTFLTRANLSAATPNTVCINDGLGALSSATYLSPALGGTGIDTSASTGLAKITAGVWSAGSVITDVDISPTAAIARSKLAAATPNTVCINDGAGVLSSAATLSTALGGTGANLSAVVGPSILTITAGAISATLGYSASSTPSTVVVRNGASGIFGADGEFSGNLKSNTLVPFSGTGIAVGSGATILTTLLDYQSAQISLTSSVNSYARGATTLNAAPTAILTFTTAANTGYTVYLHAIARRLDTGNVATFRTVVRAKNTGGVLVSNNVELLRSREAGLAGTTAQPVVSGVNLVFNVVGVAATTIQWATEIIIISA